MQSFGMLSESTQSIKRMSDEHFILHSDHINLSNHLLVFKLLKSLKKLITIRIRRIPMGKAAIIVTP